MHRALAFIRQTAPKQERRSRTGASSISLVSGQASSRLDCRDFEAWNFGLGLSSDVSRPRDMAEERFAAFSQ